MSTHHRDQSRDDPAYAKATVSRVDHSEHSRTDPYRTACSVKKINRPDLDFGTCVIYYAVRRDARDALATHWPAAAAWLAPHANDIAVSLDSIQYTNQR